MGDGDARLDEVEEWADQYQQNGGPDAQSCAEAVGVDEPLHQEGEDDAGDACACLYKYQHMKYNRGEIGGYTPT